jgi:hypothetical protein
MWQQPGLLEKKARRSRHAKVPLQASNEPERVM